LPLDPNPLPLNYRHEEESGLYYAGDYQLRHRTPGADVDVCFGGRISITRAASLMSFRVASPFSTFSLTLLIWAGSVH
jgi:hypothetical protein